MATKIALIIFIALLQNSGVISIFGTKPNLTLALLIAFIYLTKNWQQYLLLVFIAAIFLFQSTFITTKIIIAIIFLLIFYLIRNLLPWQTSLNIILFTVISSALIIFPYFFPEEILYNSVLSLTIYYLVIGKQS